MHYAEFTLSETDPFQINPLFQCDISSALVAFLSNEQLINSHLMNIFGNFRKLAVVEGAKVEFALSGDLVFIRPKYLLIYIYCVVS